MLTGNLKWGAFQAAEAFVLPSHQENFGIAVTEALSCGVPVLTTNKVNIWREIKSSNAGIIEEDDLSGIKRMLNRWLDLSVYSRQLMRANAQECFHQHFNIRRTATKLIDTLRANGVKG